MDIGSTVSTHLMYDTINHEHLDSLVDWALGKFPSSGLMLVERSDGRWFVEVDFGHEFDAIDGVSKPKVTPYVEPRFFDREVDAREFAFACIKQVYPALVDRDISEYFKDKG